MTQSEWRAAIEAAAEHDAEVKRLEAEARKLLVSEPKDPVRERMLQHASQRTVADLAGLMDPAWLKELQERMVKDMARDIEAKRMVEPWEHTEAKAKNMAIVERRYAKQREDEQRAEAWKADPHAIIGETTVLSLDHRGARRWRIMDYNLPMMMYDLMLEERGTDELGNLEPGPLRARWPKELVKKGLQRPVPNPSPSSPNPGDSTATSMSDLNAAFTHLMDQLDSLRMTDIAMIVMHLRELANR